MEEIELLRDYVRTRSDAAFAELTRRYVNLVYASALRQVRNPALAEDVTQATFLVLARKAHRVRENVPLSSWLLATTRYVAKDALKSESRRTRHEQEAAAMKPTTTDPSNPRPAGEDWEKVAPLLDDAVASLSNQSRDAIVLRYFDQKSYKDLAAVLGITEVTARQRVTRAMERLRAFFVGQGIVLSTVNLKGLMRSHAIVPGPAGLANLSATMGSKGTVIGARHLAMAHAGAAAMIPILYKWLTLAAVLLIVGGAGIAIAMRDAQPNAAISASAPAVTITSLQGAVVTADGKPVEGAEVLLAQRSLPVAVFGVQRDGVLAVRTAADGTYELPYRDDATAIVVRSDQGYAQMLVDRTHPKVSQIKLIPWAKVTGTLQVGGKPRPGQMLTMSVNAGSAAEWERWHVMHEARVKTDALGRFVFQQVIGTNPIAPHGTSISWNDGSSGNARSFPVSVLPGKSIDMVLGGQGAAVTGHIDFGARKIPRFSGVLSLIDRVPSTRPATQPVTRPSPSAPNIQPIVFTTALDGSFHIDDVLPGEYNLDLHSWLPLSGTYSVDEVAGAYAQITVPRPTTASREIDLGTLKAHINALALPGDPMPDFTAVNLRDRAENITSKSLRGKIVLLNLEDVGRSQQELTPALQPIFDRFASDPRFKMITLQVTSIGERIVEHPESLQLPWTVARTAAPSATQPADQDRLNWQALSFNRHRALLIDADGKLVAKCASMRDAYGQLDRVLGISAKISSVNIAVEHVQYPPADHAHSFQHLPNPTAEGNLARSAQFSVIDGVVGRTSGGIDVLHDGLLANTDDDPMSSFSFDWGTIEGRFAIDLGKSESISRISTYSWHRSDRGPQVYRVFASDGRDPAFMRQPKIGTDPAQHGWTQIADVDTRPGSATPGGAYAVSLTQPGKSLGRYRYLLFETFVTETKDDWGHTFFSEIDVMQQEGRP